jgi:hypothetical protein
MPREPAATRADTPVGTDRRRRITIAIVSLAVLLACAGGVWWAVATFFGSVGVGVDRTETLALKQHWQASYDAIVPIAKDFTDTAATQTIDVPAYSRRIDAARTIVDSISEVPVTFQDNRDIRDSMLSGASRVLDGMDSLLQAASRNDTSAVEAAVTEIDGGSTTLKEAGAALDAKMTARGWR